ncbi:MAG: hypothetical protein ACKOA8_05895 [Deltaproteobacteria bacterium]
MASQRNFLAMFFLAALAMGARAERLNCAEAKLTCTRQLFAGQAPAFLVGGYQFGVNVSIQDGFLNGVSEEGVLTIEGHQKGASTEHCSLPSAGPIQCGGGLLYSGKNFLAYDSAAIYRSPVNANKFRGEIYLEYEDMTQMGRPMQIVVTNLNCTVSECR